MTPDVVPQLAAAQLKVMEAEAGDRLESTAITRVRLAHARHVFQLLTERLQAEAPPP